MKYQIIVLVNSGLAVAGASVTPLDIAQQPILDLNGQPETIIATQGGVADVDDSMDGAVVAFVKVSATGYKSIIVAPYADKPTVVYMTEGSDQAPPRKPAPVTKSDSVPVKPTIPDDQGTQSAPGYVVSNTFMKYHHCMRWAIGVLFIVVVAGAVFFTSKNDE
jgi:hypothetical protein